MPAPQLEIVGIMRRSNLDRAGAEFAIDHGIRNNRNFPVHQRQQRALSHQVRVSLIFRMHRNRRITKHRFRPRSRHHNEFFRPDERITYVPKLSLPLFVHYFQIAEYR